MDHHVLHVGREHRVPVLVDLTSAPGPHRRLHPHQARRQGAHPPAQPQRRPDRRAARQPQPERPHPQHGGVPLRQGRDPGRDRHRRARHPRRRRGAGRPRRPAGRAQGLPAPLGPYGARRRRGHRRHADDRRAGARRPRADPRPPASSRRPRRSTASSHPILAELAPGERVIVPGGLVVEAPAAGRPSSRPTGVRWRPQPLAPRSRRPGRQRGHGTATVTGTRNGSGGNRNGNRSRGRSGAAKSGGRRLGQAQPRRRSAPAAADATTRAVESPLEERGDPVRAWLQRSLWDVVPRDHRDSPAALRRRQLVTVAFVVLGGTLLGLSLRIEPGSPWFYPATLGLAVVWTVGAFASGPLHLGRIAGQRRPARPAGAPAGPGRSRTRRALRRRWARRARDRPARRAGPVGPRLRRRGRRTPAAGDHDRQRRRRGAVLPRRGVRRDPAAPRRLDDGGLRRRHARRPAT